MIDYFSKSKKNSYYDILISPRLSHRNEILMDKALESLIKEHKSTTVITKSGYITLKTEEEIINYFLKGHIFFYNNLVNASHYSSIL